MTSAINTLTEPTNRLLQVPAQPIPLARPIPGKLLETEIIALPRAQCLLGQSNIQIYVAAADQIPEVLLEIGRLREMTFRLIGEGTGNARDIDQYDNHYEHIIAWNNESKEIVGAYRLGRLDKILPQKGLDGIYTSSLFHFDEQLVKDLGATLEVGRSFVVPSYQGSSALTLLWRGIGTFIARNPIYTKLSGVVSIDRNYSDTVIEIMLQYLRANHQETTFGHRITPKTPFRSMTPISQSDIKKVVSSLSTPQELCHTVKRLQKDGRSIPILLKHYLLLGARVLDFNVDPDFSDVVDGFILVDLKDVPAKKLNRFIGSPKKVVH